MNFDGLFRLVAIFKTLINRTLGYWGVVNAFAILLTWKKIYEIQISSIYIIIFGLIMIITIGCIDYKFVLKHEQTHMNNKNNINHKLDVILKKLENNK